MTFGQYMLATACQLLSLHFVAIVKLKQRYKQRVYKYYRCWFVVEVSDEETTETNGRVYSSLSQISLASVLALGLKTVWNLGTYWEFTA